MFFQQLRLFLILQKILNIKPQMTPFMQLLSLLQQKQRLVKLHYLCVCLCVFLYDNSKRNRARNMQLEYIVVYEIARTSSILSIVKVKVTAGLQKFSPFTTIQNVRSCNSTLVRARRAYIKHVCSSDTKMRLNAFTNF